MIKRPHIRPGQPLRGLPASLANFWTHGAGLAVDAANARRQVDIAQSLNPAIVTALNKSGDTVGAFTPLSVTGLAQSDLFELGALDGVPIAVTLERVPEDVAARAVVSGRARCKVDVVATSHGYADVDGGKLVSQSAVGPVVILHAPEDGEDVVCEVLLQSWSTASPTPEDVGNCSCVVGVGVWPAPEGSTVFYHPSCDSWEPVGVAALLNGVSGITGLTDADLKMQHHETEANNWTSAIFERECLGSSGVYDDYILRLEQEADGWHMWTECTTSPPNCSDVIDWHWHSP